MAERWRTGRSLGRTLYIANGPEDAKSDKVVGMMCGPEDEAIALAELVCEAVNLYLALEHGVTHRSGRPWSVVKEELRTTRAAKGLDP